jgi:fucose permease
VIGLSVIGSVVATMLLCAAHPRAIPMAGLLVLGLSLAPVYPLLILTTSDRVSSNFVEYAVGYQVASAGLGIAVIPLGFGSIADGVGLKALGPSLLAATVLLTVVYLPIYRRRPPVGSVHEQGPG